MAQPAFGLLLQRLREERRLSLRELGQLAEIDHAYIYRLESGEKESPSEEALTKLVRAVKAAKREAEMFRYLAEHTQVDPGLVEYTLTDSTITIEEFSAAAGMAFRGTGRPEYPKLIERIRRILKEENGEWMNFKLFSKRGNWCGRRIPQPFPCPSNCTPERSERPFGQRRI